MIKHQSKLETFFEITKSDGTIYQINLEYFVKVKSFDNNYSEIVIDDRCYSWSILSKNSVKEIEEIVAEARAQHETLLAKCPKVVRFAKDLSTVNAEIKDEFENALSNAWKHYDESARLVDQFESNYVECAFAKGFKTGYFS